jgi:hypothetical protein
MGLQDTIIETCRSSNSRVLEEMKTITKTITAVSLTMALAPATALAWKYVAFQGNELIYDGPIPPVDLTYPPPGEPTPRMDAADPLQGQALTPSELARAISRTHVVIVPSGRTLGRPARDSSR